ncbi:ADP-heptose:LPS heptosyltransferase [Fusobacterium sp. PH5-7]|uniref:glycosyltransferase family 9 protein n=1 Tax=Fusobacterium sp. PH5-7 TaxID=2940528 RepID=UPI0024738239|nr:glycosyltransferase family 9 protein [Fusobacterium sp. PH5-7]MDH6456550.1 ADP-heptose:LPS heptosyltransferase [Fusobacterium sp. PH5-7]
MLRKLNRIIQDYMREKRLKIGKYIWDRKKNKEEIKPGNFIENNDIKKILFMRYDGKIGDMIINTLMFREIKKKYPSIKIGVVTEEGAKEVIENNPNVDEIYTYNKNIKRLSFKIAEEKYDLLIDFSEMLRVNQMALINLCKARFNIGIDREKWKLFDISVNSGIDFKWTDHITERYSAYLKKIGFKENEIDKKYDIYIKETEKYKEFLEKIRGKKRVVLNPYGASKHKSFNLETLDKLIKYLETIDVEVILIYFGDKYKELEKLKVDNKNVYIPKNIETIQDTAYLIKKSDLVITPDTSIVHLASALNKNNISVYPPKGGKYGVDHLVWAPKTKDTRVIFCKDKRSQYDEIDINTFDFEEMKKMIGENYEKNII